MIYDTVYSNSRPPFVSAALEAGARAANGLSMLLHQGALAFEIWFGREAPIDAMRRIVGRLCQAPAVSQETPYKPIFRRARSTFAVIKPRRLQSAREKGSEWDLAR